MTERRPWWYSGDEEEASATDTGSAADASAPATETADAEDGADPRDDSPSGRDWMALLAGAQRVVDWAAERVIAPHSDHLDPREHPECVVCRTLVVVGDLGARVADATPDLTDDPTGVAPDKGDGEAAQMADPMSIAWIPIRDSADHP